MWGRGIAPVPTNYFPEPFRLGRVSRTGHDHWDCRLDACENPGLPVWKPAVASWDGGDAPSPHVGRSGLSQFFLRSCVSAVVSLLGRRSRSRPANSKMFEKL